MRIERIKYWLIDSINDDIRALWELNYAITKHYTEFDFTSPNNPFVPGMALCELIKDGYVEVVSMKNPSFDIIEYFNLEDSIQIALNQKYWIDFESDVIVGVLSKDLEKSIELENILHYK